MKPHYPFIASKNYKGGDLRGCASHRNLLPSWYNALLIPDPLWTLDLSRGRSNGSGISERDLISLNTSWYGLTGSLIWDPIVSSGDWPNQRNWIWDQLSSVGCTVYLGYTLSWSLVIKLREKLYRGNRITRGSAKYPNLPCITWDQ